MMKNNSTIMNKNFMDMAEGSGIILQRIARGSQDLHHLHQHLQQGDASGHVQLWEALGHLQAQTPSS
jgi:hypothetical protein